MRGAASIKLPTSPFSWLAPLGWGGGTPRAPVLCRTGYGSPSLVGPPSPNRASLSPFHRGADRPRGKSLSPSVSVWAQNPVPLEVAGPQTPSPPPLPARILTREHQAEGQCLLPWGTEDEGAGPSPRIPGARPTLSSLALAVRGLGLACRASQPWLTPGVRRTVMSVAGMLGSQRCNYLQPCDGLAFVWRLLGRRVRADTCG